MGVDRMTTAFGEKNRENSENVVCVNSVKPGGYYMYHHV
jgi:hypothetical protein